MKAPLLASIDIGSNSVLLLVGRVINGKLHTELQRKETIRLGGALDSERNLEPSAMERGLECLRRYAALIAHIPPVHRRVVATQTLREARNRDAFLHQAQAILGCSVELISGEREAALIYQGVSSLLPASPERRLVVDIGGRSTEICLGQGSHLEKAISCPIGSVACAQRFSGMAFCMLTVLLQRTPTPNTVANTYGGLEQRHLGTGMGLFRHRRRHQQGPAPSRLPRWRNHTPHPFPIAAATHSRRPH